MEHVDLALENLIVRIEAQEGRELIPFHDFLDRTSQEPEVVLRSVFQLFGDMIHYNIEELPETETRGQVERITYDASDLFIKNNNAPFFADQPFVNRLVDLADSFKQGVQQNRVYLFDGPPGSGKSIFLNNLLKQFERYTRLDEGATFETVWKLDVEKLGEFVDSRKYLKHKKNKDKPSLFEPPKDHLLVPCPNHDHPILQVQRRYRKQFIDELISDESVKERLFNEKQNEWIFKKRPCTVCSSLTSAIMEHPNVDGDVRALTKMLYARRNFYDRKIGEGVSIFNPSDALSIKQELTDETLQQLLNSLFRRSDRVRYLFSRYARTNNGVYALMDVKGKNKKRFLNLHGIVSDAVHKVGPIEETVSSLFFGVINPEDRDTFEAIDSFKDRITTIPCNYVLNYKNEMKIYQNAFGDNLKNQFLPGVLENFARIIVSTRFNESIEPLKNLIDQKNYSSFCDENMVMLKLDVYANIMPVYLAEKDRRKLCPRKKKSRSKFGPQEKNNIPSSNFSSFFENLFGVNLSHDFHADGEVGCSGRKSVELFGDFISKYSQKDKIFTMNDVMDYFHGLHDEMFIGERFPSDLDNIYRSRVLEEMKESLYDYNEDQISKDLQNYLFAISFDQETTEKCPYTGNTLKINENFFSLIESRIFGNNDKEIHKAIRHEFHGVWLQTLTQEIGVQEKEITDTSTYKTLYNGYISTLKENVLVPFQGNENFLYAIKSFGTDKFQKYDKHICRDVAFLIGNLQEKFGYTQEGAKVVCSYAVETNLLD